MGLSYNIREKIHKYANNFGLELRHIIRRKYLREEIKKYMNGKTILNQKEAKDAREFWERYTKHFSPLWHDFYKLKTGKFDVRYVPDDVMWTEIELFFNDYESSHGIDNKCNYGMYFPEVKVPKTLFRKMRNIYHDEDWSIITKEKAIENCRNEESCILKCAVESGRGGGVFFWDKKKNSDSELVGLFESLPEDAVAQSIIIQHPVLEALHKESVNCIRVITLAEKTGIRVVSAYMRMGQGDHRVDYHGGCTSSIYPDGHLYEIGCVNDTCDPIDHHECGIRFKDFVVPHFKEVKDMAMKLHQKIGDFRWISWDFSVSPEGEPIFIEMNLKYGGLKYHQLGFGPIFGDDTERILNEVYNK